MRKLLGLVLLLVLGCSKPSVERCEWVRMGTIAALQWEGGNIATSQSTTAAVFEEVERLLNAHNPESELSRLAALKDLEVLAACNAVMRPCYETAFMLQRQTDGLFNPRWRGKATLDLGAIAKGFAVDLAAEKIMTNEHTRVLIDLGGNLKAVKGDWRVGVLGGENFILKAGEACATSAKYYRGDHIHNGRTGVAVTNELSSVTVVHPNSAMIADGLSTIMFILGREKGELFLKEHYPEARAIWYTITK